MGAIAALLDELDAGRASNFGGDLLDWTRDWQGRHRREAPVQHLSKIVLEPETLVGAGGSLAARLVCEVGRAAIERTRGRHDAYREAFLAGVDAGQNTFLGLVDQLSGPLGLEEAVGQTTRCFADVPDLAEAIVHALRRNAGALLPTLGKSHNEIESCREYLPLRHGVYEHSVIRDAAVCVADLNFLAPDEVRLSIGLESKTQPLVVFASNIDTVPKHKRWGLNAGLTYFVSLDPKAARITTGPAPHGVLKVSDHAIVMVNPSTLGLIVKSEDDDALQKWVKSWRRTACLHLPLDTTSRKWPTIDRFFRRLSAAREHGILGTEQYQIACSAVSDAAARSRGAVGEGQRALVDGLLALKPDPALRDQVPAAALTVVVDGVRNFIGKIVRNQLSSPDPLVSPKLLVVGANLRAQPADTDHTEGAPGGGPGNGDDGGGSGNGDDGGAPHNGVERRFDVLVKATDFEIGANIVVVAMLKHPKTPPAGQKSVLAVLPHGHNEVVIVLDCHGFRLDGPNEVRRTVPPDADSEPAAFLLWIEDEKDRWIQVKLYQAGTPVASAHFTHKELTRIAHQQVPLDTSNIDVTLDIETKQKSIKMSSPQWQYDANRKALGSFKNPARHRMNKFRQHLKHLQKDPSKASSIENELKDVGLHLRRCLPDELASLLTEKPPAVILLNHDRDFDFPFELVLLEHDGHESLLGDVIPVCRWVMNSKFPSARNLTIDRVALLKGNTTAADDDFLLLTELTGNATPFTEPNGVYESVFAGSDYNLVHFTGHVPKDGDGYARLILQGGELIADRIGRKKYQAFGKRRPLITLNGCASGTPHLSFFGAVSFPQYFIDANTTALIGTLWPVHEKVAHEFSEQFYRKLDGAIPIARAMHEAKHALWSAANDEQGNPLTLEDRSLRSVSARSYCLYAHPSTILQFPKVA